MKFLFFLILICLIITSTALGINNFIYIHKNEADEKNPFPLLWVLDFFSLPLGIPMRLMRADKISKDYYIFKFFLSCIGLLLSLYLLAPKLRNKQKIIQLQRTNLSFFDPRCFYYNFIKKYSDNLKCYKARMSWIDENLQTSKMLLGLIGIVVIFIIFVLQVIIWFLFSILPLILPIFFVFVSYDERHKMGTLFIVSICITSLSYFVFPRWYNKDINKDYRLENISNDDNNSSEHKNNNNNKSKENSNQNGDTDKSDGNAE